MNIVKKEVNLNVRHPNNYQIIHAMQGDNDSIEITATIYDGNQKYKIDCDMVEIECISPKRVKNSIKVESNTENTVTFILNKKILAEEGKHEFVIRFMKKPDISLTTFPAVIYVSQAPIGELTTREFATITELVFETKDYLNQTIDYYNKLIAEKGQAGGIATLDDNGKVPLSQLTVPYEIWRQTEPSDQEQRENDYWLVEY